MMFTNIGLYSYGAAALAYSVLTVRVLFAYRQRPLALGLAFACGITALWAGIIAGSTLLPYPNISFIQLGELLRNGTWCFVLLRILAGAPGTFSHSLASSRWNYIFFAICAIAAAILFAPHYLPHGLQIPTELHSGTVLTLWLATAVAGLLILEQIFRNSDQTERWSIKFLCLGLGVIFAYDFFMYAEGLLFKTLNQAVWQARGLSVAMTAILVGIAVSRLDTRQENRSLAMSRHVVFYSATLLATGIYLILMALVGYFIRYLGGTWAGVFQIVFIFASLLLLLALLFSGQIRARGRVWLSKHFFAYKYDYRHEWLQFTDMLASDGFDVPERVIRAIGTLVASPGGVLFAKTEEAKFYPAASWEMAGPDSSPDLGDLEQWLASRQWIIDLPEWRRTPDLYDNLQLPESLLALSRTWLIIPLLQGDIMEGILVLKESEFEKELNWEDRDLLKVASRQAASHLAQWRSNRALVEARQFEAFNRLSAYVVHDLKNILAQQALIVSNAAKHKDNPAFVDDVIQTVDNSVKRMTRLMAQMRSGERSLQNQHVSVNELLREAVMRREHQVPKPTLSLCEEDSFVQSDSEQLVTVFTHIIQNAQEATHGRGHVRVSLESMGDKAIVQVEDNGTGMDESFIKERLFRPFDSTKGLTGMGIGAFESREFVRSIGGEIEVSSRRGQGSVFRIVLPCISESGYRKILGE